MPSFHGAVLFRKVGDSESGNLCVYLGREGSFFRRIEKNREAAHNFEHFPPLCFLSIVYSSLKHGTIRKN